VTFPSLNSLAYLMVSAWTPERSGENCAVRAFDGQCGQRGLAKCPIDDLQLAVGMFHQIYQRRQALDPVAVIAIQGVFPNGRARRGIARPAMRSN